VCIAVRRAARNGTKWSRHLLNRSKKLNYLRPRHTKAKNPLPRIGV